MFSNVFEAFNKIFGTYFQKKFQRFPKAQICLDSPILSAGKQGEWIGCDMDFFESLFGFQEVNKISQMALSCFCSFNIFFSSVSPDKKCLNLRKLR